MQGKKSLHQPVAMETKEIKLVGGCNLEESLQRLHYNEAWVMEEKKVTLGVHLESPNQDMQGEKEEKKQGELVGADSQGFHSCTL